MLIDGFTVFAQMINFLILLFLLRRFLYRPILRIMNERQEKIVAQLAEAKDLKQVAIGEAESYRQKRHDLQKREDVLLAEAKEKAETLRKELLSKAHKEVDEKRTSWHQGIEAEKHTFIEEMRRAIGQQVYGISKRALADLANADLEVQIIGVFLQRIQEIDEDAKAILIQAITDADHAITLRSTFEIATADRQRIKKTLGQVMGSEVTLEFELDPALLCGVELSVHAHKLGWTLEEYLTTLEENFFEAFDKEAGKAHVG